MATKSIVFLSDVHIGMNTSTNWYQRDVHEPMLLAIFNHVIDQAADVAEFVILGDLVDQWTYVPSTRPPSFEAIAAANPAIFGKDGAIARTVQKMPGRVTFIAGNHDMALDANALSTVVGQTIGGFTGSIYEPPAGRRQIACTHGHMYSIFNAPDLKADPKLGLPLGHFITRLAALHAERQLKKGQTAADLAQSGDPTGAGLLDDAFKGIFESLLTGDVSLARVIMDTLLDAVGEKADTPFVLLDGSIRTAADVIREYDNLWDRYNGAKDPSIYGRDPAVSALKDTDARNTIAPFAEVLSVKYPVVIMGHTHTPDDEAIKPIFKKPYVYGNAGFGCPSRPDMANDKLPAHATFIELGIDSDKGLFESVMRYVKREANGDASVAPAPLGATRSVAMRTRI